MRSSGTKKRKKGKRVEKEWEGGVFDELDGGGDGDDGDDATNREDGDEARKRARMSSSGDERKGAGESSASDSSSSDADSGGSDSPQAKSKSKRNADTPVTTPSETSKTSRKPRNTRTAKQINKSSTKGKRAQKDADPKDTGKSKSKTGQSRRPRPAYRAPDSQSGSPNVSDEDDGDQEDLSAIKSTRTRKQKPLFLDVDDGEIDEIVGKSSRHASNASQASTPLFLTDENEEDDLVSAEAVARKPKRGIVISDDEDE
jgi:hypothetical protein